MTTKRVTDHLIDAAIGDLEDDRLELAAERERLRQANDAARAELARGRRIRLEAEIDRILDGELAGRLTPAMRKAGLRDAFLALRESPVSVRLSEPDSIRLAEAEGRDPVVDVFEVFLSAFRQLPDFLAGTQAELATSDCDDGARLAGDLRTAEDRAFDLAHGISDERALELQRKHPWMRDRK